MESRIRIRIEVKSWIQIRIKMKSWIPIRIRIVLVLRNSNPTRKSFLCFRIRCENFMIQHLKGIENLVSGAGV
jgi:hypothetical protein